MRLSYSTILIILLISYLSRAQEIPQVCLNVCDYQSAISCKLSIENATSWDLFLQEDCLQRAIPYSQLILLLYPSNTGPGLEVEIDLRLYNFSSLSLLTNNECSSISSIKLTTIGTYTNLQFLSMDGCFDETYIKGFIQGFPSVNQVHLQQIIMNSATLVGLWKLLPTLTGIVLTRNVILRLDHTLFQDLANIETLALVQNSVRSLEDITFLHLTTLQRVELNYNEITQIHDRQFHQLRQLQVVEIEHNSLTSLPSTAFEECNNISQILLTGNPLGCDCDLSWVNAVNDLYGIDFGTATCTSPTTDLITSSDLYLTCVEDSQECFDPTIVCDNGCINTDASFSCVCLDGYSVAENRIDCEDTNECSISNGNCTHTCSNSLGSFLCSCQTGYELSSDNRTCVDVNECEVDQAECVYGCVNAIGSYYCECESGESVCRCEEGTEYCVHNDMCLPDITHCCPSSEYYCSVIECCVDNSLQCPPTSPANTSTPTVLVDGADTSVLVITVLELPSALVCNFAINGVTVSRAEYQVCDVEWENCVSAESDTSQPFTTTHHISTLTDYQFTRCIAFTTSGDIFRSLLVTPNFTPQYIATQALPNDPAIIYALASNGNICPINCPALVTALSLPSDTIVSQVTIATQECVMYGSIYGLGYSLYKLEILFDQNSTFFVGDYVLTVGIAELSIYTSQNVSFSFPSNQYCPAEFLHGVLWDVTPFGVTATKKCSDLLSNGDSSVGLTRLCNLSTQSWDDVVSTCYYILGDDVSPVSTIKAILTLSKESYFNTLTRKRDVACPQASNLFEYFQNFFSSLSLLQVERNGYFDTLWLQNGEDIRTILNNGIATLISSQCYSEYWIGEIIQNIDICNCQSKVNIENTVFVCTEPICDCTGSGCQCVSPFTGDGEHCGRDEDGDNRPEVSLPCEDDRCIQDNCPLSFNPNQGDCNSDGIGDACQEICYEEVDGIFNLTWVCTLGGKTAVADCISLNQKATRYCEGNDTWAVSIDTFNCTSQFYSDLNSLNRSDALSQLATSIAQEKPVYSGDIDISVDIMNDNLDRTKDPDQTEGLTVVDDTLSIIDQLIDIQVIDLLGQTEYKKPVAETLIRIVDTHAANIISQNTSVKLDNFTNLHFETRVLKPGDIPSEPVKLSADNLAFDYVEGQQQQPEITIPIDQLNSTENVGVVFFVKKNIGTVLFNYGNDVTVGKTGIPRSHFSNLRIVSPLISAQVMEGGNKIENFHNTPVQIKLPLNISLSDYYYSKQTCVSLTSDEDFSTWIDFGIFESAQTTNLVECNSIHLTSFAVLAAINGLENQDAALTIVSYIGVGISIVCLALCIYIYIVFGSSLLKQAHHYTHFNLIISLLLLFILFSVGLELPYRDNFGDYIPCKVASGLLQYLVLCLFAWMLAEGVVILILMQWPFYQFTYRYAIIVNLVCWITPGVYVTAYTYPLHNSFLTPTTTPLNNTQKSPGYCWIQSRDEYMNIHRHNLVVVVPIVAILACNLALFLFVISKAVFLYWSQKSFDKFTRSRRASISLLRLFLVLTPAQGFLWILGLFNFDPASPFAWVFTILGSLQGLFILIFVVLFRKDIREAILNRFSQLVTRVTSITGQSRNVTSKS